MSKIDVRDKLHKLTEQLLAQFNEQQVIEGDPDLQIATVEDALKSTHFEVWLEQSATVCEDAEDLYFLIHGASRDRDE